MDNNPYGSRSPFERIDDIKAERDWLLTTNNNLLNECKILQENYNQLQQQVYGMRQTDISTICQLTATIAAMKSERESMPRHFTTDGYGNAICIEPSGKRKPVGSIKIDGEFILVSTIDSEKKENLVVEYHTGDNAVNTAVIPFSDITNKKLLQYFPKFRRTCSDDIAKDYLYHTLISLLDAQLPVLELPEFPGLTLHEENDIVTEASYRCYDEKIPDVFKKYISDSYQKKTLPAVNKTPETILQSLIPHLNSHQILMLISFGLTGMISSYLKAVHNPVSMILVISTNKIDAESLAGCFIKTYNRMQVPKSLTMSKTELIKLLKESNDETVVLKDDTTSESNVKRTSSVDTILSFSSDENCKPFNLAIISNTIQYFITPGKAVILELDENFCINFSEAERYRLSKNLDEMYRCFVDIFCKYIKEYGEKLISDINTLKKESRTDFISDGFNTVFAVLYAVLQLWAKIFRCQILPTFKPFLKKQIMISQDYETGKDSAIVNSFFKTLNSSVSAGILNVKELSRDMKFEDNQNIAVIKDGLMMMEENTLKEVFLQQIPTAKTVNSILSALSNDGYLTSTNGHRKPTTVYNADGIPMQKKLIAFKYIDMVSSETLNYIESLRNKQHFSCETNVENFIPLIQNKSGQIAGQILVPQENQHRFITGKSGSGKTVFLIQLMYHLSKAENRIIVFDSSSSFTEDSLLKVLPQNFVRENITFHKIDEKGVPVYLLHTYSTDKPLSRRNMLFNILCEAIHDPSQNQEIALKNMVKSMMKTADSPKYIDFIEQFEYADNASEKSIENKFSSVFEDIIDSGIETDDDWFTFLDKCKKIVIISTEDVMNGNGSQLTDMLLASLYYAQLHETEPHQISIFIDEIQNQNLSEKSIISKILKEGRKNHIDLNFATQYVNDIRQNRMMKQAGLSVYFKPDLASKMSVANMLGLKKSESYKLDNLSTGECFVQGTVLNFETGGTEDTVISGKTYLIPDSPLNK
ncbi:MAG: ATP-binding protein [Ruminococcus sp.]|nr:ATP-binding protein [Ruminococcus sp.]